jgi:predicted AAA+ superfamily ATPase
MAKDFPRRRELQPRVLSRLLRREERRALVLMGPRQVGKTTLLLQVVDDLLDRGWPPANVTYFDFSDHRITRPVTAQRVVEAEPEGLDPEFHRIFLLDEIASVPRWDRWLKQAVDQHVGHIVATDSAASLIRAAGRESGPGRWDELWLEGLTFREFVQFAQPGESENALRALGPRLLEHYLLRGGFPEHAGIMPGLRDEVDDQTVLRKLREDVVDRALLRDLARDVDDPEPVRGLFVYLAQASGAVLNLARRASDLRHDPRTVSRWVHLLEDTLLLVRLSRFAEHPAALLRARPKIFAADHGLVNAFALLDPDAAEVRGRVFETVVFRHLRELQRKDPRARLSFYHDGRKVEGDFILQLPGSVLAIEVTSSTRPKQERLDKLRTIARRTGADRRILVYNGVVERQERDVDLVPVARFLWEPGEVVGW